MVKIAGSKKLKRQMAPLFWGITRKNKIGNNVIIRGNSGVNKKIHDNIKVWRYRSMHFKNLVKNWINNSQ